MIQRIQTLYLLVVVILSGIVAFSPLADLVNTGDKLIYLIDYKGISLLKPTGNSIESSTWYLTIVAAIIPLVALITIFSFKNRRKQIQLLWLNMMLMLMYYAVLFLYVWFACQRLHTDWYLRIVTILPVVNMMLSYLAVSSIRKDEKLVKSLDRLR